MLLVFYRPRSPSRPSLHRRGHPFTSFLWRCRQRARFNPLAGERRRRHRRVVVREERRDAAAATAAAATRAPLVRVWR